MSSTPCLELSTLIASIALGLRVTYSAVVVELEVVRLHELLPVVHVLQGSTYVTMRVIGIDEQNRSGWESANIYP